MVRRAVLCGGIDGVVAGVFNGGQRATGLLCKEVSLEFVFTPYV